MGDALELVLLIIVAVLSVASVTLQVAIGRSLDRALRRYESPNGKEHNDESDDIS